MRKESTRSASESRAHWEDLEEWVRGQIQGLIQELLEEEITELLGRAKSARGSTLDGAPGYRNGYGKPRRLTLSSGTIQVEAATSPQRRGAVREPCAAAVRPQEQEGCRSDPRAVPAWSR